MSNNSLQIVHEGWLTKSPPSKPIWRARLATALRRLVDGAGVQTGGSSGVVSALSLTNRWRRRWFVLRHSGELPGQYFLEYYTDRSCRKLKGKIDLDQCEQVDAGLTFMNRKVKYPFMFDVKTPKRIYYLAAETEEEMNKWVECVCQVCSLKADKDDIDGVDYVYGDESDDEEEVAVSANSLPAAPAQPPESPPLSPASTISGPYIAISECISGKPLSSPDGIDDLNNMLLKGGGFVSFFSAQSNDEQPPPPAQQQPQRQSAEFYDAPRKLHPPRLELQGGGGTPPPQSPATDVESVFTDDEWVGPPPPAPPSVNWETFPASDADVAAPPPPRPSDGSCDGDTGSWSVVRMSGRLVVMDRAAPVAPPRPPKPSHLAEGHNYLNLDKEPPSPVSPPHTEVLVLSDETYDFPRSHQAQAETRLEALSRHCYLNAAPGQVNGEVFRYDFRHEPPQAEEEPTSPRSEGSGSGSAIYSNLPSPLTSQTTVTSGAPTPPAVNRCLKPGRKLSDSTSVKSMELSPSPGLPPSVDRKLKPQRKFVDAPSEAATLKLSSPPACRTVMDGNRSLRKTRAAPSPTPPSSTPTSLRNGLRQRSEQNTSSDEDHRNSFDDDQFTRRFPTRMQEIQYLDLDLESDTGGSVSTLHLPKSPEGAAPTGTVYKTVDFVKTEAFNRTRQHVEERRKCATEM